MISSLEPQPGRTVNKQQRLLLLQSLLLSVIIPLNTMSAVAGVFGAVADTLGIYGFLAALFAGQNKNICTVRVAAALNGNGLSGADGGVGAVRLYNENQQLIGSRNGAYIGSGGFGDFAVQQPNTQQATYVQIGATNDALCIPYATTTWVDGSHYGWVGDWGWACGLEWYYGNVAVSLVRDGPNSTS